MTVSDPPFKSPITDQSGVTSVWRRWFSSIPVATKTIITVAGDSSAEITQIKGYITDLYTGLNGKADALALDDKVSNTVFNKHQHVDMEKMSHPLFPMAKRVFEHGVYGITKIIVSSSDGSNVLIFTKTITYDASGRIISFVINNAIDQTSLTKTFDYDNTGLIIDVNRVLA